MEFKVLFIKQNSLIPNSKLTMKPDEQDIREYDFLNNFHCFKIFNEYPLEEKGIEKIDNEVVNSLEFFEVNDARRLISIGLIFVNTLNGNIYHYNCSNKKVEKILLRYFMIKDMDTKVDPDKLEKITKIEVKLFNKPQMNLLYEFVDLEGFNLTKALDIQDKEIEKFTAKFEFTRAGVLFGKKNLKEVISKYENLTVEGLDGNDNIIKIKDSVQLIIKVEKHFKSFAELDNVDFSEIIRLILEKERSLNGY